MKGGSMTGNNKRGLSTIIATLLIILLTLVSVGIIWVVIRNVVQSGTNQVDLSQKCLAVELSAVTVNETSAGNYAVTLHRGSDSQGDLGIKVVVFNSTNNSGPREFVNGALSGLSSFGELDAIGTLTKNLSTYPASAVTNGEKIEFTAFFRDASNNELLCSQTGDFIF